MFTLRLSLQISKADPQRGCSLDSSRHFMDFPTPLPLPVTQNGSYLTQICEDRNVVTKYCDLAITKFDQLRNWISHRITRRDLKDIIHAYGQYTVNHWSERQPTDLTTHNTNTRLVAHQPVALLCTSSQLRIWATKACFTESFSRVNNSYIRQRGILVRNGSDEERPIVLSRQMCFGWTETLLRDEFPWTISSTY